MRKSTSDAACKQAFNEGKFDSCLELLSGQSSGDEWEVKRESLNKATLRAAKTEWKGADQYSSSVQSLFLQLARFSSNGQPGALSSGLEAAAAYNLSTLAFHNGQYKNAAVLLESVLLTPSTNDNVVRCAGMLLVEIALILNHPGRAMLLIETLKGRSEWSSASEKEQAEMSLALYRIHLQLKWTHSSTSLNKADSQTDPWKLSLCRSHMELLAGNARSALTHLLAASKAYPSNWKLQQMGESRQVIINNAMGCIYGSILRKPHLAYGFFRTAISACTPEGAAKESGLVSLPVPWRLALQYNVALALLQARQTQPAFDCFLNVLQTFHSNPRIWLRLAECCILAQKATNKSSFELSERMRELIKQTVGVGLHKKVVLRVSFDSAASSPEQLSDGGAIPMLSLDFAALCLRNALVLLPTMSDSQLDLAASAARSSGGDVAEQSPVVDAPPGPPLTVAEAHRLRCSVLCASAYVSLGLGEAHRALRFAETLSSCRYLSSAHKLLSILYRAEALLSLDRVDEALQVVHPEVACDLRASELWPPAEAPSDAVDWFPNSPATAKSVIIYNRALLTTIAGHHQRAAEILQEVGLNSSSEMVVPVEGIVLGIYLQLKMGNVDHARRMIEKQVRGF